MTTASQDAHRGAILSKHLQAIVEVIDNIQETIPPKRETVRCADLSWPGPRRANDSPEPAICSEDDHDVSPSVADVELGRWRQRQLDWSRERAWPAVTVDRPNGIAARPEDSNQTVAKVCHVRLAVWRDGDVARRLEPVEQPQPAATEHSDHAPVRFEHLHSVVPSVSDENAAGGRLHPRRIDPRQFSRLRAVTSNGSDERSCFVEDRQPVRQIVGHDHVSVETDSNSERT